MFFTNLIKIAKKWLTFLFFYNIMEHRQRGSSQNQSVHDIIKETIAQRRGTDAPVERSPKRNPPEQPTHKEWMQDIANDYSPPAER